MGGRALLSRPMPDARLVVITGPTASGKSALAVELARAIGGEIVSADSRHVYRGMDVGTGKEPIDERHGVPFHLVDVVDPDAPWTLADYQRDAHAAVDATARRGHVPLLVGGTGLYVRAVAEGLVLPPVAPQPELRAELEERARSHGLDALVAELERLDPATAAVIDRRNPRRIIRAIEVSRALGVPFSQMLRRRPRGPAPLIVALDTDRAVLHRLADERVERMFARGFVEEVRRLLARYDPSLPSFSAVGYREVASLIRGDTGLEETVARVQRATHAYQRRQLTWLRKVEGIRWLDPMGADVQARLTETVRAYLDGT